MRRLPAGRGCLPAARRVGNGLGHPDLHPVLPAVCDDLASNRGSCDRISLRRASMRLAHAPWPSFDPDLASDDQREYVIQLNGRLRHKIVADADMPADALMSLVKSDRQVKELLAGKTIVKEIAVPGRLVNFVVRDRLQVPAGVSSTSSEHWRRHVEANASDDRSGSRAVKLAMSIFLLKCPGLRTFVASLANTILLRPAFRCRERRLRCHSSSHTG
jgi:hypothetical protein